MASSGNFNTNKYTTNYNGTIGLNLSWSITSQSVENNSSTIHWVLKSNGTMSSGYYVKGGPITVTIGGVTVLNITSRINVNGSGGFSRSGDITITHDESGDKSVSMSVRAALYASAVNCTGSKTYALDHIDRCAIITSATDFTDESDPVIVYTNPAGSELVYNLAVRLIWLEDDGISYYHTAWRDLPSDDGGTYTYDFNSYRNAFRSTTTDRQSVTVTIELHSTVSDGSGSSEYFNTKTVTCTIINANPIPGNVTYRDTNSNVVAITGSNQIIVQSQSTLNIVTGVATRQKNAQIVSYSINFNGVDTDITSNRYLEIVKPAFSGTYTATVTVTDSRGLTATASVNVPITAWTTPTAENSLERINGFETNTILTVKGTISTVTGSTIAISERHRIINGTWSSSSSVANNTPTTLSLDNTKEWEVEVSVSDSFTSSTPTVYILTVGKGIPIMFIDTEMNSLGINGFPDDDNQLYIDGNIKATGELTVGDAAGTRTNLGLGCTELFTGSMSSGTQTFADAGYTMLIIIAKVHSSGSHNTTAIPMLFLSSSNSQFCTSDETNYITYSLKVENGTITLTWGSRDSDGFIEKVYGII